MAVYPLILPVLFADTRGIERSANNRIVPGHPCILNLNKGQAAAHLWQKSAAKGLIVWFIKFTGIWNECAYLFKKIPVHTK